LNTDIKREIGTLLFANKAVFWSSLLINQAVCEIHDAITRSGWKRIKCPFGDQKIYFAG